MRHQVGSDALELLTGDITRQTTEAIVNAANSSLMGGGGVDGAIHRAGGPAILQECKQIRARQGQLDPGGAVVTSGGDLPAVHVIHTVGPVWRGGGQHEAETLARCYRSSLAAARERGVRSVAFPSISTGAYGYPVRAAAAVALETVVDEMTGHPGAVTLVRFVLFDDATLEAYQEAVADLPTVLHHR